MVWPHPFLGLLCTQLWGRAKETPDSRAFSVHDGMRGVIFFGVSVLFGFLEPPLVARDCRLRQGSIRHGEEHMRNSHISPISACASIPGDAPRWSTRRGRRGGCCPTEADAGRTPAVREFGRLPAHAGTSRSVAPARFCHILGGRCFLNGENDPAKVTCSTLAFSSRASAPYPWLGGGRG